MMRFVLALGVLTGLLGSGCVDDEDGLAVRGTVEANVGGTMTGFRFTQLTNLSALPAADGEIAGSCEITKATESTPSRLEIAIARSMNDVDGVGMRELVVRVDDVTNAQGAVTTVLGMRQYVGVGGTPSCSLDASWADETAARAGVISDCVVQNSDGESATLSVDVDLVDCTVH